jgi:hypothetical protein
MELQERIRLYASKLDPSIQRFGGEAALLSACTKLVIGWDLSPEAAFPYLVEWNAKASPPWSDRELMAKLRHVNRMGGPRGKLRGEGEWETPAVQEVAKQPPCVYREETARPFTLDANAAGLRSPTLAEQRQIARLRGISESVPILAFNLGFLKVGRWRNLPAFFFVAKGIAQARRLDGIPWTFPDGDTGKAWTIRPVDAFGIRWNLHTGTRRVMIAEGLVASLELLEAILRAQDETGKPFPADTGFLCAYNDKRRLSRREAAFLAERRTLILADAGDSGLEAWERWRGAIIGQGGRDSNIEGEQASEGDLGHALRQTANCPEVIRRFIA